MMVTQIATSQTRSNLAVDRLLCGGRQSHHCPLCQRQFGKIACHLYRQNCSFPRALGRVCACVLRIVCVRG